MNRLERAVGISSADLPNNQCKDRHRLLIAARKRNARANRKLPGRVSEAFTRWSSNLGLCPDEPTPTVGRMEAILFRPSRNSSRIRPKNWPVLLKGPKIGPNSR